ncbi:Mut7-C ubiquitin/RNAse domain-containing protein [Nodosilinea sp. LEGE 06152]|uniref:Mut7-C RNAse domain-containing protein n=1 Tax=Nodosilinea sp. LEGE 06152 TaxID=2777966 RepID=UPI0018810262|nr:Mut7-C RNAse domain-containing protein [Nodosilinea sp. LEGE 06152]MBE9155841.1 Mut7-C ubiquitin/RNAse domain-containing protein [Nodosilinea sp. LEGE 06152]
MQRLVFRFYAELNDFLSPEQKQAEFAHWLKEPASIKDAIEALGVPHPEVDLILVNGVSVGFDYLTQHCDRIAVYPLSKALEVGFTSLVRPAPLPQIKFVLDVHLGKLATYLRLLGFNALYRRDYDDAELAQISSQQQRILLTQDRGLLKRSVVTHGYIVRSHVPEQQAKEVLDRFHLHDAVAPLERCPRCNGQLVAVDKAEISDRIPPLTRLHYNEFSRCQSCSQIYWKGAHYDRIQQLVERVT